MIGWMQERLASVSADVSSPSRTLQHGARTFSRAERRTAEPGRDNDVNKADVGWAERHLLPGSRVIARGLVRAAHLNGSTGRILGFDHKSDRYVVAFSSANTRKLVRYENLLPLLGPEEPPDSLQAPPHSEGPEPDLHERIFSGGYSPEQDGLCSACRRSPPLGEGP